MPVAACTSFELQSLTREAAIKLLLGRAKSLLQRIPNFILDNKALAKINPTKARKILTRSARQKERR
jgi:hypothetical protein